MSEAPLSEADGLALELKQTMDRAVDIAKRLHAADGSAVTLMGAQIGFIHNLHKGVRITASRQTALG